MTNQCLLNLIIICLTVHIVLLTLFDESVFFILEWIFWQVTHLIMATLQEIKIATVALGTLARFGDVSFLPLPAELLCYRSWFAELAEVLAPEAFQFIV